MWPRRAMRIGRAIGATLARTHAVGPYAARAARTWKSAVLMAASRPRHEPAKTWPCPSPPSTPSISSRSSAMSGRLGCTVVYGVLAVHGPTRLDPDSCTLSGRSRGDGVDPAEEDASCRCRDELRLLTPLQEALEFISAEPEPMLAAKASSGAYRFADVCRPVPSPPDIVPSHDASFVSHGSLSARELLHGTCILPFVLLLVSRPPHRNSLTEAEVLCASCTCV